MPCSPFLYSGINECGGAHITSLGMCFQSDLRGSYDLQLMSQNRPFKCS